MRWGDRFSVQEGVKNGIGLLWPLDAVLRSVSLFDLPQREFELGHTGNGRSGVRGEAFEKSTACLFDERRVGAGPNEGGHFSIKEAVSFQQRSGQAGELLELIGRPPEDDFTKYAKLRRSCDLLEVR